MTYPTRVRPLLPGPRVATRWLILSGTLVAGSLLACAEDAGTTDDISGTPTTGTQASTTGGVTSVTTGNTSTIGGTSAAGTLTTASASVTTGGTATTGSTQSSSTGGTLGSTTGTTGGAGGAGGAGGTSTASTEATTGGGTGGTGSTGFQPCPAAEPCKVLPLGDSITVGLGFDGGYRVELFHLALEGGHDITFTGTQQPNGPAMVDGVTFPRNHEGISGQFIAEIGGRIPSPGLNEMPHIILVHAGTNDVARMPAGVADRLPVLLDELIAEAPDALIVMGNIIPLPNNGAIDAFNATIPPLVEARATAGAHVIFVDQFEGFPNDELGDGIHPNQAGYERMAGKWYEAIEPYLP